MFENTIETVLALIAAFLIGVTVMLIIAFYTIDEKSASYRQGQIDAQTGKINYALKVLPDSSRVWNWVGE